MRIRKTELRERRWRRLKEAAGEETVAGALDGAAKHYLTDLRKKQKVVDNLDGERVEELSTAFMPMDRESRVERE